MNPNSILVRMYFVIGTVQNVFGLLSDLKRYYIVVYFHRVVGNNYVLFVVTTYLHKFFMVWLWKSILPMFQMRNNRHSYLWICFEKIWKLVKSPILRKVSKCNFEWHFRINMTLIIPFGFDGMTYVHIDNHSIRLLWDDFSC